MRLENFKLIAYSIIGLALLLGLREASAMQHMGYMLTCFSATMYWVISGEHYIYGKVWWEQFQKN